MMGAFLLIPFFDQASCESRVELLWMGWWGHCAVSMIGSESSTMALLLAMEMIGLDVFPGVSW